MPSIAGTAGEVMASLLRDVAVVGSEFAVVEHHGAAGGSVDESAWQRRVLFRADNDSWTVVGVAEPLRNFSSSAGFIRQHHAS
eukprot:4788316-Prymnesium_polylepis.1